MQTLFLAQQGGLNEFLDVRPPPPLPDNPVLEVLFLERPWPVIALLVLAATIAVFWLQSQDRLRRGLWIPVCLLACAAGLVALAMLVKTPREEAKAAARGLIDAVARGDVAAVEKGLTPDCVLHYWLAPEGLHVADILPRVRDVFDPATGEFRLREWNVERMNAHALSRDHVRVQVKVWAALESSGFPGRSWWALDMDKGPDGAWRASGMMPLSISGVPNASGR